MCSHLLPSRSSQSTTAHCSTIYVCVCVLSSANTIVSSPQPLTAMTLFASQIYPCINCTGNDTCLVSLHLKVVDKKPLVVDLHDLMHIRSIIIYHTENIYYRVSGIGSRFTLSLISGTGTRFTSHCIPTKFTTLPSESRRAPTKNWFQNGVPSAL